MERKRREIVEGEEGNLKWKGKGMKMIEDFFFLTTETTEICLGYAKMDISKGKNWEMDFFS